MLILAIKLGFAQCKCDFRVERERKSAFEE
jgi:hypothetical protein